MSKIETTSKVALKLTSRINLERRGALTLSFRLWTQPTIHPLPPPQPPKGHPRPKATHSPHRNHYQTKFIMLNNSMTHCSDEKKNRRISLQINSSYFSKMALHNNSRNKTRASANRPTTPCPYIKTGQKP